MKLYKGLILIIISTILTACIPDTFTKWQVQDPTSGSGAENPDGGIGPGVPPGTSTPPNDIAYTPPSWPIGRPEGTYFYTQTSQIDSGEITEPLNLIALNGGVIKEGDMSFFVSQVKTQEGILTGDRSLPEGMFLNPLNGQITGFAQVFTDGNFYTIQGDHIAGTSVNTTIQISIATKPVALAYPQSDPGLTLVLTVDTPENFMAGNAITSKNNAKGIVTYVDFPKKTLHVQYQDCPPSSNSDSCPIFVKDDELDNTTGFYQTEAKITEEVTYAFDNQANISQMIPLVAPAVDGENPSFSISPDIRQWGIDFDTSTGEISGRPMTGTCSPATVPPTTTQKDCDAITGSTWTPTGLVNLPKTKFSVVVKNILGDTANISFYLSSLDIVTPQSINLISYNYQPGYRVVLNLDNIRPYQRGSVITNQFFTLGTIITMDEIPEEAAPGQPQEDFAGSILVLIDNASKLKFANEQSVDDSNPYLIPLTKINQEPELVFQLGVPTAVTPTITPDDLDPDEISSLSWNVDPNLPHICNSESNTGSVFYPEEDDAPCRANNGTCPGDPLAENEAQCDASMGVGIWDTDGLFYPTNELFFNKKTGKFGAKNPTKAFEPQEFEVTVTTLEGSETKTNIIFGFQSSPENLSYSNQVLLEIDKEGIFNVNDYVSSPSGALGIVKAAEKAFGFDPLVEKNLLVVKVLDGEFEKNADIDNVKVFTYQKANINEIEYGQVGILTTTNASDFQVGEEISNGTGVTGIVQYLQNVPNILWVRLIEFDQDSATNPLNETFSSADTITGADSVASSDIMGIFGDILKLRHNGAADFAAGMDVAASPTEGFGVVEASDNDQNNIVLSHASGTFLAMLPPNEINLFTMNPWDTENPPLGGFGNSAAIQEVVQVQTFLIDRSNPLPIQPVIDSPDDNGVTFSIEPPLPIGLTLDENTGKISITEDTNGPIASNLEYYMVIAKNLLGESVTKFGLKVREVFAIEDVTGSGDGESPNLTSVLHKSGQGYNNFPCRVTADQVKADNGEPWATRAKDIVCIYDVGEADLFYNGLNLKVNVGTDLCQYVEQVPLWFYQWQVFTTENAPDVTQHIGEYQQPQCAVAQPDDERMEFPYGTPAESCIGDNTEQDGPNCDEGEVPTVQRQYTVTSTCTVTERGTGDFTEDAIAVDTETCFNRNATCSQVFPGSDNREGCLAGDPANPAINAAPAWNSSFVWVTGVDDGTGTIEDLCLEIKTEDNRTDCENSYGDCSDGAGGAVLGDTRDACGVNGGVWEPQAIWSDNITCESIPGIPGEPASCGGEQVNCIAGPGKDAGVVNLTERVNYDMNGDRITTDGGNIAYGQVTTVSPTKDIIYTYESPNEKGYKSNLYLSNYSRLNSCTPYGTPSNGGNDYEYNINTWTSVGQLNDPLDFGTLLDGNDGESDLNPFAGGNGVYDYRCLDGARNVRARIRLLIRDWDQSFKPSNRVDVMNLENPPWDPDGTLMDFPGGDDAQGFPANTFNDWDDQNRDPIDPANPGLNLPGTCSAPAYRYPEDDL